MLKEMIIMGILIGMLLLAGCSQAGLPEGAECIKPSDCERLAREQSWVVVQCEGNWQCNKGMCSFVCATVETTGNNETDEIGKQLNQASSTQDELDIGYIDSLEKELSELSW